MSVQSATQAMGTQRTDSVLSAPVAEALLRSEDQMHVNMDKTRSAFDRMQKKASEAQTAKDKEITELKKALELAKEQLKAQEETSKEKESALVEMNKTLSDENASLKAQVAKTEGILEKVKDAFTEMRKEPSAATITSAVDRYPNGWWYNIERIVWHDSSRAIFPVPGAIIRLCKKIQSSGI